MKREKQSLRLRSRRPRVEQLQHRQLLAADFPFVPSDVSDIELAAIQGDLDFEPADSPFEIRFLFGEGIRGNTIAQQAVERAANQWRRHIHDPATVIIEVELANLPPNILGGALSESLSVPYSDLRQALVSDAASEHDDSIVASLPAVDQLQFTTTQGVGIPSNDVGDPQIEITRATAKAVGLLSPNDPDYVLADASIVLNSAIFFGTGIVDGGGDGVGDGGDGGGSDGGGGGGDPTLPPGIDPDLGDLQLDGSVITRGSAHTAHSPSDTNHDRVFSELSDVTTQLESTMVHEIGHALGFISGLDEATDTAIAPTAMDLFRFAADVRNLNPSIGDDFATFPRELRGSVNAVLNFVNDDWNVGRTEYPVERGEANGGFQASHWLDEDLAGEFIGLMDPTGGPGSPLDLTVADLRFFDLIGWDMAPPGEEFEDFVADPRVLPQDVNGDGSVSAVDALMVINSLSRNTEFITSVSDQLDVNRDGGVSSLDALVVINHIRRHTSVAMGTRTTVGVAQTDDSDLENERLLMLEQAFASELF